MSMFSDYIRERGKKNIIENDKGFATYILSGDSCYIEDIYIVPEHRHSGEAARIADVISGVAKASGCRFLLGSVVPSAHGSTDSCKVLFAYGLRLVSATNDLIWFRKEI